MSTVTQILSLSRAIPILDSTNVLDTKNIMTVNAEIVICALVAGATVYVSCNMAPSIVTCVTVLLCSVCSIFLTAPSSDVSDDEAAGEYSTAALAACPTSASRGKVVYPKRRRYLSAFDEPVDRPTSDDAALRAIRVLRRMSSSTTLLGLVPADLQGRVVERWDNDVMLENIRSACMDYVRNEGRCTAFTVQATLDRLGSMPFIIPHRDGFNDEAGKARPCSIWNQSVSAPSELRCHIELILEYLDTAAMHLPSLAHGKTCTQPTGRCSSSWSMLDKKDNVDCCSDMSVSDDDENQL